MNQREGVEWGDRERRKWGGVEGEGRKGGGVGGGRSGREEVVHYKFLHGDPLFPNLIPPGYHHAIGHAISSTCHSK